jgi:serine/threonine protein kinase
MTDDCKDFIQKCLKKDPKERLGATVGLEEIISHPWFSDINISDLIEKKISPEFKPKLSKN